MSSSRPAGQQASRSAATAAAGQLLAGWLAGWLADWLSAAAVAVVAAVIAVAAQLWLRPARPRDWLRLVIDVAPVRGLNAGRSNACHM